MDSITLEFSGKSTSRQFVDKDDDYDRIVDMLDERSDIIARDIERGIPIRGVSVRCSITFSSGSVEWAGIIEIASGAWPLLEALATIGGVAGLVQLVGTAVQRALGSNWPHPHRGLPSRVRVLSMDDRAPSVLARSATRSVRAYEIAAILAGIGVFVAGVAAAVHLVLGAA